MLFFPRLYANLPFFFFKYLFIYFSSQRANTTSLFVCGAEVRTRAARMPGERATTWATSPAREFLIFIFSYQRTQHLCWHVVLRIEPRPHACQASALQLEPHPQPRARFLKHRSYCATPLLRTLQAFHHCLQTLSSAVFPREPKQHFHFLFCHDFISLPFSIFTAHSFFCVWHCRLHLGLHTC